MIGACSLSSKLKTTGSHMGELSPVGSIRSEQILTPEGWVSGAVAIEGSTISSVGGQATSKGREFDASEFRVIPGLIDLQVNGGWGIDLAKTPHRFDELSRLLTQVGVTAWLPTLVTSAIEKRHAALDVFQHAEPGGATALGWHFEGPWISPKRAGAHYPERIESVPEHLPARHSAEAGLALVTLAPELPGAMRLIAELHEAGVVVSCGHSNADAKTIASALEQGATMGTHLFNAMSGLDHRSPGVAAGLLDSDAFVGLIVDGLHVDEAIVRLVWKLASDRLVLVSDAMAGLGLDDDAAALGESRVFLDGRSARLADGTLAGSVISLRDAVRNLMQFTNCSLADALGAATSTPARAIGATGRGALAAGNVADLVVVDDELEVIATVVGGQLVYSRGGDGAWK